MSLSVGFCGKMVMQRLLHFQAYSGKATGAMSIAEYPKPRRDETCVEELHGHKVVDPYRWMEDADAPETKAFVDAQNRLTMPYIQSCPHREKLRDTLKTMMDFPKIGCPFKRGDRYFYFYNSGLQNQSVLHVQDSLDAEPRVFVDPNLFSEDGTVALTNSAFSEDGATFAYGLSTSGSDWNKIHFRCVETGKDYPEVLEKVKFSSIAWTHDNKGIFYGRFNQEGTTDGSETTSNLNQKLYYHRLGTDQSEDVLCVQFTDHPKWRIGAEVSDCGRYLILLLSEGCKDNMVYYVDLQGLPEDGPRGLLSPVCIVDKFEADYEYVTNTGPVVVFRTNKSAPNYHLVTFDLEDPAAGWSVLLPEHSQDVLDWAACVNTDRLVVCYMHDVKNILQLHSLSSGEKLSTFPLQVGTVVGYSGKKKDTAIFYKFTSFLSPGIIYRCELNRPTIKPEVFKEISVAGFNPSEFECYQVFYSSKDGTKIPMFIMHKKGLVKDGTAPCLLYAYGGFNISITPTFSVSKLVFVQHLNGVFALPNIRGGGEYGERWHNAGRLFNKQNCFDDFACAAEYLVRERYTSSHLVSCEGGSNGGLLVGAVVNQRPELFGAAIAHVGVMDMLRFHKFTIGYAWVTDFGNPDEKEHFENIIKYSPLHNIRKPTGDAKQYPATLLLTADHDDRVVPLHSLKYIAELQHTLGGAPGQTNPLLIRVDTKAGHGAGKPTAKQIDECSDIYCFIIQALGLQVQ
ncbi:prolyl endopeptidase-like isoform X5 [Amphibalanus amphitrite]|uniref:prolyl endopeptidase-like isoform X5 n=1 Tax=Amphibalanus amphitrite TaxID=1232801 RepID=UPI001C9219EE|nr:prolyl endopeptidase-like isoform X5 [Amphibalanus amphitrite]